MFLQFFYEFIPSSILPRTNPDAPNFSKRGKIVEELWKNCRKILRALFRQAAGKNPRSILRLDERAQNLFFNLSTISREFFPTACWARALKTFYNSSTILP
jgi:hypothetical protein